MKKIIAIEFNAKTNNYYIDSMRIIHLILGIQYKTLISLCEFTDTPQTLNRTKVLLRHCESRNFCITGKLYNNDACYLQKNSVKSVCSLLKHSSDNTMQYNSGQYFHGSLLQTFLLEYKFCKFGVFIFKIFLYGRWKLPAKKYQSLKTCYISKKKIFKHDLLIYFFSIIVILSLLYCRRQPQT